MSTHAPDGNSVRKTGSKKEMTQGSQSFQKLIPFLDFSVSISLTEKLGKQQYLLNRIIVNIIWIDKCKVFNRQLGHRVGIQYCFPDSSVGKESACNAGDPSSIPGLGRSPGKGIGYPLQNSCLENFMGREAWQLTVHRITKSQRWPSDFHFIWLH